MTENKEQDWENITLKSLEAKLQSLSELQVPQSLRAKLFASIPERQPRVAPGGLEPGVLGRRPLWS
jgi:hypothetical protein